uniref:Uncharacterized protein n=1 Tax=Arundo donax TaxID=35708 RepID=A0A0A9TIF6_ARUDO
MAAYMEYLDLVTYPNGNQQQQ